MPERLPTAKKDSGGWVQTERAAHEAWAALLRQSPRAAELLHLLVARVGEHNAVVISQKTLAGLMGRHVNTVASAVKDLVAGRWVEVRQVGDRGTVNAYVLNRNVVWSGPRDGIRYALFSAAVVVSDQEQPDRDILDQREPLRALPAGQAQNRESLAGSVAVRLGQLATDARQNKVTELSQEAARFQSRLCQAVHRH